MSKEQLEELKGVLKSWEAWNDWNESQRIVLKDLTYYLKRVQELEEENKQYINIDNNSVYIAKENKIIEPNKQLIKWNPEEYRITEIDTKKGVLKFTRTEKIIDYMEVAERKTRRFY